MTQSLAGYLNVLKPPGQTSQQVVARVRRLLGQGRVGHGGALDPSAIGVLPLAIGTATRLAWSEVWDLKLYWADIRFGAGTDTDDADGRVLATGDPSGLDMGAMGRCLRRFVGDLVQRPPAYSAIHVEGTRSYAVARKGGLPVLPARTVRIDAIGIVQWRCPTLGLLVQCHSGTYVRSLARDLGEAAGCPAHLAALVRLRVGPFGLQDALSYGDLEAVAHRGAWRGVLWPADLAVSHRKAIMVDGRRAQGFQRGQAWLGGTEAQVARVYTEGGDFLGLVRGAAGKWQPTVVLPRPQGRA